MLTSVCMLDWVSVLSSSLAESLNGMWVKIVIMKYLKQHKTISTCFFITNKVHPVLSLPTLQFCYIIPFTSDQSVKSWKELITRHVFVKQGCPGGNKVKIWQKSKSYILTPSHSQEHVMSVKCEEPIDELTVQVWLLYHQPNFKYCTLFLSGTELWTDRQTDRQTDRRTIQLLNAPGGPFRPGA